MKERSGIEYMVRISQSEVRCNAKAIHFVASLTSETEHEYPNIELSDTYTLGWLGLASGFSLLLLSGFDRDLLGQIVWIFH